MFRETPFGEVVTISYMLCISRENKQKENTT